MENVTKFVISYLLPMIAMFCFGYGYGHKMSNNKTIELPDTLYNSITLDSIKYNIIIKDSIVTHIKKEAKDEIKKVYLLNDSDAVVLFKELASAE